ncbi:hypothetical protein [Streptomyces sp. NPDC006551]|uniref:hypothetical protein n=1 Tax=Streptomyces sp. NPDC006551 TaxID=3157178 RepID=UPI0033BA4F6E
MYAEDFALHGDQAFTGAFNWYRNIERNNELLAPFRGRGIDVPALYIVGDRDMVTSLRGPDGGSSLSEMFRGEGGSDNPLTAVAPQLHDMVVLPGQHFVPGMDGVEGLPPLTLRLALEFFRKAGYGTGQKRRRKSVEAAPDFHADEVLQ